jgi:hypothetical protein
MTELRPSAASGTSTGPAIDRLRQRAGGTSRAGLLGDRPLVPPSSTLPGIVSPTLRTALGALRRNKLRSVLTALGIIIGVAAVIAMSEIGQGSKSAIQRTIAKMGANRVVLFPGAANNSGVSQGRARPFA